MKSMEEILRADNCFLKSEIEGLSDLIWSMGARCIYSDSEALKKWFHSPIPAFDNRVPMDILREDGEGALYDYMLTLPS